MPKLTVGRVAWVDGQGIATQFFAFVGPLLPLQSLYVVAESYSHQGNVSTHSMNAVPLPLHWGSVVLGWLRVWLPLTAVALPFALMWGESVDLSRPEMLWSAGLLAAWLVTFFFGRVGKDDKARLIALGEATGMRLDPRHLEPVFRATRRDVVANRLELTGVTIDDNAPEAVRLADLDREQLLLVYAYARYAVGDAAWEKLATAAWAALPAA
jgi:hypothetical protein